MNKGAQGNRPARLFIRRFAQAKRKGAESAPFLYSNHPINREKWRSASTDRAVVAAGADSFRFAGGNALDLRANPGKTVITAGHVQSFVRLVGHDSPLIN